MNKAPTNATWSFARLARSQIKSGITAPHISWPREPEGEREPGGGRETDRGREAALKLRIHRDLQPSAKLLAGLT